MEKYIGTYRVCCEFCQHTLEPIRDDIFIQCSKGGQIYRVYGEKLAYYRPSRGNSETLAKEFIDLGIKGVNNCSTDGDILIYFDESGIDIVANKVGVITTGASIKPYSVKNLRKLDWFKRNKDKYIKLGLYKEQVKMDEEKKIEFLKRLGICKNND